MNGRPLTIGWVAENVPAILEAWFAGTQGGTRSPTPSSATSTPAASCP